MSELALVDGSAGNLDVNYWTEWLVFAARVAEKVSDTEFVATALRGRPEAVAATILYGAEVGITPMQALQGIHVVDGRPAPSSELMRALIFRAGHTIDVHEASGTRVRVSGLRRGRPESERLTIEWTLDMARAAGLLGRRNWQNYPRAMLIARATGDLARILFPDVVKGLGYIAEDVSGDFAPDGSPERPTAAGQKRTMQRRMRTVVAPPELGTPAAAEASPDPVPVAPVAPIEDERPSAPTPAHVPHIPDELEPEPSAPEPPVKGPAMIAPGPLKALHAGLTTQLGTVATREEKHALVAAIIGHPITSTKDLTRHEGYQALDYLSRFESGSALWKMDPDTGEVTVQVLQEPPEEPPPDPADWRPGDVAPDGSVDVRLPYKDND